MEITNVKISKVTSDGDIKAVATVTIDNMIAIHGIKIVRSNRNESGVFMAMPSRMSKNGSFSDIVHPVSTQARKIFEDAVFDAYNKMLEADSQEE